MLLGLSIACAFEFVCYVLWLHVVNRFTKHHGKSLLFDLVMFRIKLFLPHFLDTQYTLLKIRCN